MAVGGKYLPSPGPGLPRVYRPAGFGTTPPPWVPPPIPAPFYNPSRDVEEAEGKRGTAQQERSLGRQRTNAESDYATSLSLAGTNHANLLKQLGESFARLGARQGEHENAQLGSAGVGGGALLASAAVRSANQGKETARESERYGNETGRLTQGFNELAGPGGTLAEELQNVGENEQGFQTGIEAFKGHEAAEHGYEAPTAPGGPRKLTVGHFVRGSYQPAAGAYPGAPAHLRVYRPPGFGAR